MKLRITQFDRKLGYTLKVPLTWLSKNRDKDRIKRVNLVQTCIDSYRTNFLLELSRFPIELKIFSGESYFQSSVKSRINFEKRVKLTNIFFLKRKLLIQLGSLAALRKTDVLIIELNPRILTNWILLFGSRFLKKESLVWGHFSGRSANKTKCSRIRFWMAALTTKGVVCYTIEEYKKFRIEFPNKDLYVAPNSLYTAEELSFEFESSDSEDFIYCGRLDHDKNVEWLISEFIDFFKTTTFQSSLHVVGDGPLKESLANAAIQNNLGSRIIFYDHVSDFETLKNIYSKCLAGVTSGFVGLNAIQVTGFGLPLIFPQKLEINHAPEAYVLNPFNSYSYILKEGNLRLALIEISENKYEWISRRNAIRERTVHSHSVNLMAEGMFYAIR